MVNTNIYYSSLVKSAVLGLVLLSCLAYAWPADAAIAVRDDTDQRVMLPRTAQRVVVLAPYLVELLNAAGMGARVVGVTDKTATPATDAGVQRVGPMYNPDLKRILGLKPDLIVAAQGSNSPVLVETLRNQGIPVYVGRPGSILGLATTVEKLGTLGGTGPVASRAAQDFRKHYKELYDQYAAKPALRVFYGAWLDPILTINGHHLVSRVLELCNAHNIYAGAAQRTPEVSPDALVEADPDVVLLSTVGTETAVWAGYLKRLTGVRAVREGNVIVVPAELRDGYTPRLLSAVDTLCRRLDQIRAKTAIAQPQQSTD